MQRRQVILALLSMTAGLSACAMNPPPSAATETQTVFVMRHLQKGEGQDPPLTQEGEANARAVANLLADRGIRAIFVTDTLRARQTAAPLATRLGLTPVVYDPRSPDTLVAQVRAIPGNALVVGHSNTVPDLVQRFGGPAIAPLDEQTDFGTIWAVDRATGTAATLTVSP